MINRLLKSLAEIPDHLQALALIALGAGVSLIHSHEAAGQSLVAAGLAMWRGKQ